MRRLSRWFLVIAGCCWGTASAGSEPSTNFRVYADLLHEGSLAGPLATDKPVERGFCITVPIPTSVADLDEIRAEDPRFEGLGERLARVRVETPPGAGVLRIACKDIGENRIRLYRRDAHGWLRIKLGPDHVFSLPADGDRVIEIAVAVVYPRSDRPLGRQPWASSFTLEIGLQGAGSTVVRIPCRVAPFLIPSPLDPVADVLIVDHKATEATVEAMKVQAAAVGFRLVAYQGRREADMWMQDTMQPGLFAYPTPENPRMMNAALIGGRRHWRHGSNELDARVRETLQKCGFLTVQPGVSGKSTAWTDRYGNLEATPPHVDGRRRRFPYGRILTGRQGGMAMHPDVLKFLEAQGLQWPPIVIDTSWLMIGHVDEVVQFVPAKNEAGFRVLLPSPRAARKALDAAVGRGLGDVAVFAGTRDATTVGELRRSVAASDENRRVDANIEAVEKHLALELNLDQADFVHLPVLFDHGVAVIPNGVNGLVANGHFLVPDPHGPMHEGKDLFAEAIVSALSTCDVKVAFIDVWDAYHIRAGELHCGTNAIRRLRDPAWWKYVEAEQSNDSE
ncbi:MAG: protein-arginine deiminase family protein [Paludisphaera borealis]|uniref:protein-arginine deiminase family protein n=1 Tax=Paludisphaera borealis TaxID=1387353 RepID=UPI0028453C0B|nr:protein-arginine deiminase family protein [Paludisphaera borealis]MDR3618576.1 protein-arginine deiminase family protein [Paludisphaera borealis]